MTLKVISLNLWWGGELFPAVIEFLKTQDADVVALQEVYNASGEHLKDQQRSVEVLRDSLGYPHDDFAEALLQNTPEGTIPSGNAVLSKYGFRSRTATFLQDATRADYDDVPEQWPIFPRVLQHVELDTPAGAVNLFNMHGVWDLDGNSPSPARRTMIDRTLAATKNKPNVILTGDTNATLGNPLWKDVEQQLKSVFGNSLTTTFNMRRKDKPGYATAAVDLMYVSPSIKIISAKCPDVDISDHLPLVAELEI